MKFLQNKGNSYTTQYSADGDKKENKLGRGLEVDAEDILTHPGYENRERIDPPLLTPYIGEDYLTVLRQVVSMLDKTIGKRNSLRAFHIDAYVDRVHLANELWIRICRKVESEIRALPDGEKAFHAFTETWNWKAHPYAKYDVDPRQPLQDDNAKRIPQGEHVDIDRASFEGRWHKALWVVDKNDQPDYPAIADKIMDHLYVQELEICDGRPKKNQGRKGPATGAGLMHARGHSITRSANDPRLPKPKKKQKNWDDAESDRYLRDDIAAKILMSIIRDPEFGADTRRRSYYTKLFGRMLYEHFGPILNEVNSDKEKQYRYFSLHNAVRQFYQDRGKSERFWIAERSGDRRNIEKLLPADKAALLDVLKAKERNSSISKLIRTGKLIVHSADMMGEITNAQESFQKRMDYFATSPGQSEIKRNEAFTRVWRNSVALSMRTLKAWADPEDKTEVQGRSSGNGEKKPPVNDDLATVPVSFRAVQNLDHEHYRRHVSLVFGNQEFGEANSRAAIFRSPEKAKEKETLWGMLRLAAEIRNRTNHFSTKQRLVKLVTGGVLNEVAGEPARNIGDRTGDQAHTVAFDAFTKLLDFDLALQRKVLRDDLNRLEVLRYTKRDTDELRTLLEQVSHFPDGDSAPAPKFISVLKRVHQLAKNDRTLLNEKVEPFLNLDLEGLARTTRGENHCRIGMLRMVYAAGFQRWLQQKSAEKGFVQSCIQEVINRKQMRVAEYQDQVKQFYRSAQSVLDQLAFDRIDDLATFQRQLVSHSAQAQKLDQTYKADEKKQSRMSNWVEDFRLDLYGLFLGIYLSESSLDWIWTITDSHEPGTPIPELAEEEIADLIEPREFQSWNSAFYAWLYLVPVDDAALLRHQFRKTAVLETKGSEEVDDELQNVLDQMNWLMGLYTRVQSAGFKGDEHLADGRLENLLYEDHGQYIRVYSGEADDHKYSLPGIRRGLRQMQRFGHHAVLHDIFDKHRITSEEVDRFEKRDAQAIRELFNRRKETRELAVALMKEKKPDKGELERAAEDYKQTVCETAIHDFAVQGARLSEHSRLHHLMMRIVGRLADFTGTWERDRAYLFLGMLHQGLGDDNLRLEVRPPEKNYPHASLGLQLSGDLAETLKNKIRKMDQQGGSKDVVRIRNWTQSGFLSLWNDYRGFEMNDFSALTCLLDEDDRKQFKRYFEQAEEENPKDFDAAERMREQNASNPDGPQIQPRESEYRMGRKQIRNDFAHYNVISTRLTRRERAKVEPAEYGSQKVDRRKRVNFCYLVNVVRSLMSYDRKMKNAVSKAISDILLEEGLVIEWTLRGDRLGNASVRPALETHLDMGASDDARKLAFKLPQSSVRFTSMVKALFDFDIGGYRQLDKEDGKARGIMTYPEYFTKQFDGEIPPAILELNHPAYVEPENQGQK